MKHWIKTNNKEMFNKICKILDGKVEYQIIENKSGYLISFMFDKPIQAISERFYFTE